MRAQETIDAFYSGAARVAERLLEGVASHLGLPRAHFAPSFEPHTSYLRLNYYPPCPEPCGMLSVNRHSDAGALTVLLQETGTTALQVHLLGLSFGVYAEQYLALGHVCCWHCFWSCDGYRAKRTNA